MAAMPRPVPAIALAFSVCALSLAFCLLPTLHAFASVPSSTASVTDTVSYSGLEPDREYTIRGTLMDKATGEYVLIGSEYVTATRTFVPKEAAGTVDIVYTYDAGAPRSTTPVPPPEPDTSYILEGAPLKPTVNERSSLLLIAALIAFAAAILWGGSRSTLGTKAH